MSGWKVYAAVLVGIPVALFFVYVVFRIISAACLHSWFDMKAMYTKKLFDMFKENPKGEGKQ